MRALRDPKELHTSKLVVLGQYNKRCLSSVLEERQREVNKEHQQLYTECDGIIKATCYRKARYTTFRFDVQQVQQAIRRQAAQPTSHKRNLSFHPVPYFARRRSSLHEHYHCPFGISACLQRGYCHRFAPRSCLPSHASFVEAERVPVRGSQ